MKQLNLIARRRRKFWVLRVLASDIEAQRRILEGNPLDQAVNRLQLIRHCSQLGEQVARDYYSSLQ